MKKYLLAFGVLSALLSLSLLAQTQYVSESVSGNTITFKNVSSKAITEMGGDLLEKNVVVGIYKHTFASGLQPGATEPMTLMEQAAPSVNLKYINFSDGTFWRSPASVDASTTSTPLTGQTLTLDISNSYCKANTFTPGFTLHGTWRNKITGCTATGSIEKVAPYACAKDPNYMYPDLAQKTCRPGICCMVQYTALRPTVAADADCLSTGNGFYTGVWGEQQ